TIGSVLTSCCAGSPCCWSGLWRSARSAPGPRCGIFCRPCTWASLLLTGPRCTSARRPPVSKPRSFPPSRSTRPLRFCGSRPTTPKPRSYTAYLPETAETCITKGLVCLCVYYLLSNLGLGETSEKVLYNGLFRQVVLQLVENSSRSKGLRREERQCSLRKGGRFLFSWLRPLNRWCRRTIRSCRCGRRSTFPLCERRPRTFTLPHTEIG